MRVADGWGAEPGGWQARRLALAETIRALIAGDWIFSGDGLTSVMEISLFP
jgi:hypothetical protein